MKKIKLSVLGSALLISTVLISSVNATDILSPANIHTVSSPYITFDETDFGAQQEWYLNANRYRFEIIDDIDDVNHNYSTVFQIQHSVNNKYSFIVDTGGNIHLADGVVELDRNHKNALVSDSSGDINLADGSVFIDKSSNKMGIGTILPENDLHIRSSTASIQLHDTHNSDPWLIRGSGGSSFFDIGFKQAATLYKPFVIEKATQNYLLTLDRSNQVGIGTSTPTAKLDVRGTISNTDAITSTWSGINTDGDGLTKLLVLSANNTDASKSSDAGFSLRNEREGGQWNFRTGLNGNSFMATKEGTTGGVPEFELRNLTSAASGVNLFLGNGARNVAGNWVNASSRALKENIKELSSEDALIAFRQLQPMTYNYKSDKSEQVVGFIAEDVPELVAMNSRKGLSSMDMIALLTKVVQIQDTEMNAMKAEVAKLKVMQKKVAQMEAILTNLALDTTNTKKEKVSLK